MEEIALGVRRRDVFQVAHADMAFRRMLAPALYRREPLEALIDAWSAQSPSATSPAAFWSVRPIFALERR